MKINCKVFQQPINFLNLQTDQKLVKVKKIEEIRVEKAAQAIPL